MEEAELGIKPRPSGPCSKPSLGWGPPQRPRLTCADQLPNELLLHADVDGQLPDLLLGLGQPPLGGSGDLAGPSLGLAPTDRCIRPTVKSAAPANSGGGTGGKGRGRSWAGADRGEGYSVQGSRSGTTEGRRGRGPLYPTKPTSGLQDGCTQLIKAKLRVLPSGRTPWAGLLPLAPLADPVSRGQTQESVPAPSPATSWTGGRETGHHRPSIPSGSVEPWGVSPAEPKARSHA